MGTIIWVVIGVIIIGVVMYFVKKGDKNSGSTGSPQTPSAPQV